MVIFIVMVIVMVMIISIVIVTVVVIICKPCQSVVHSEAQIRIDSTAV